MDDVHNTGEPALDASVMTTLETTVICIYLILAPTSTILNLSVCTVYKQMKKGTKKMSHFLLLATCCADIFSTVVLWLDGIERAIKEFSSSEACTSEILIQLFCLCLHFCYVQ